MTRTRNKRTTLSFLFMSAYSVGFIFMITRTLLSPVSNQDRVERRMMNNVDKTVEISSAAVNNTTFNTTAPGLNISHLLLSPASHQDKKEEEFLFVWRGPPLIFGTADTNTDTQPDTEDSNGSNSYYQNNIQAIEFSDPLMDILPSTYRQKSDTSIPMWMKEYFDWHRKQTSMLNETNWNRTDVVYQNALSKLSDKSEKRNRLQREQNYNTDPRFLIVRCLHQDKCGGLSDRIKPMLLYVAIAALTRRILMIRWERPYPIEEFLVPNEINWTVPSYMLDELNRYDRNVRGPGSRAGGLSQPTVSRRFLSGPFLKKYVRTENSTVIETKIQLHDGGASLYSCLLTTLLNDPPEVNATMSTGYQYCEETPRFKSNNKQALDVADGHYRRTYHDFFRSVFKPNPNVQKLIDERMEESNLLPGQFIGSHYRSDYGPGQAERVGLELVKKAAKTKVHCAALMRPGYPIYFAADTSVAINAVQQESKLLANKNITIITAPSPPDDNDENNDESLLSSLTTNMSSSKRDNIAGPLHIEHDKGSVEEFYPAFVDLLVMGNSMCQLHFTGGFGSFASLLSYNASCFYSTYKCEGSESHLLPGKCCMKKMWAKKNTTNKIGG